MTATSWDVFRDDHSANVSRNVEVVGQGVQREVGYELCDLFFGVAHFSALSSVVSGLSPLSSRKTASNSAGSVALAFSLIVWCAPGASLHVSPEFFKVDESSGC